MFLNVSFIAHYVLAKTKNLKKTTCQKLVAMVSSNLMDKDLLQKNDSQMNCRKSDQVWLL